MLTAPKNANRAPRSINLLFHPFIFYVAVAKPQREDHMEIVELMRILAIGQPVEPLRQKSPPALAIHRSGLISSIFRPRFFADVIHCAFVGTRPLVKSTHIFTKEALVVTPSCSNETFLTTMTMSAQPTLSSPWRKGHTQKPMTQTLSSLLRCRWN